MQALQEIGACFLVSRVIKKSFSDGIITCILENQIEKQVYIR